MALSTKAQIGIGGTVVAAVLALILFSPDDGVLEYAYVDAVVANPGDYSDREFKVHGNVVEGSLRQAKNGDYHFVIEYKGERLKVIYDDLLPDTFAEGGEVVMTGRLDADGTTLRSSEMTAKCPSKYEEEPGAPPVAS